MRCHRRQPIRLRRPWDSPGKNTGVGCLFFLQCMKVKSESEVAQSCPTLSICPWSSPGKNAGVGCLFFLQCMKVKSQSEVAQSCPTLSDPMDCSLPGSSVHGIFQARVLEWVAIAFSALTLSVYKNLLQQLTKFRLLSPIRRNSDSLGSRWQPYICTF